MKNVHFGDDTLSVDLVDGRMITVPLAWYPRLLRATAVQRAHWQVCSGGFGVHWPELDEDLCTEGLLRGVPAPRVSSELEKQGLAMVYGEDKPTETSVAIKEPGSGYAIEQTAPGATEATLLSVIHALPPERREDVLNYAFFVKARLMEKAANIGIEADKHAWMQASIRSLAKYWDTPEEDAAWAYLQEGTSS